MDRDRRLTGLLRGQTDNPLAPPGFEVNNPWRVCDLVPAGCCVLLGIQELTKMSTGGEAFLITEAKCKDMRGRRVYANVRTSLPYGEEVLFVLGGDAKRHQDRSMYNHIFVCNRDKLHHKYINYFFSYSRDISKCHYIVSSICREIGRKIRKKGKNAEDSDNAGLISESVAGSCSGLLAMCTPGTWPGSTCSRT